MRMLAGLLALIFATPAVAQVSYPPAPPVDTSAFATKSEVQAAQTAASSAATAASTAQTTAQAASTAAASAVKSVNGTTPNGSGAVTLAIPDTSNLATKTEVQTAQAAASNAATAASTAQTAASGAVKNVNGATPNASGALTLTMPSASTSVPPCIGDTGAAGTAGTMLFAPWNHTHCSKARRATFTSAADGTYSWTFPTAFTAAPVCAAVAEVAAGVTDVINVQIVGTPTTTSANFLVNRTNRSVVSLINLTVLSVPSSPGATKIHAICIEP